MVSDEAKIEAWYKSRYGDTGEKDFHEELKEIENERSNNEKLNEAQWFDQNKYWIHKEKGKLGFKPVIQKKTFWKRRTIKW